MSDVYNGWTNYETWCVNLWLDNDERLQREKQSTIRYAHRKIDAEDVLKDWVEEMVPNLGTTLWADLLGAALSEVDWREIVDAEWDELHEDDNADPDEG